MDAQTEIFFDELVRKQQAEIARLTAEVGTLESRLADEQTASHEYMKLIIRLRAALEEFLSYKWKSADKDNMEFTATVTRFTLDKARAALANECEAA